MWLLHKLKSNEQSKAFKEKLILLPLPFFFNVKSLLSYNWYSKLWTFHMYHGHMQISMKPSQPPPHPIINIFIMLESCLMPLWNTSFLPCQLLTCFLLHIFICILIILHIVIIWKEASNNRSQITNILPILKLFFQIQSEISSPILYILWIW